MDPSQRKEQRAKHWCFTINNPKPDHHDLDRLVGWNYCVVGNEVCPSTGTPHLQGYVCFDKQLRMNAVKKMMPTAHLEIMLGTPQQASDYCKKEGDFTEFGVLPKSKSESGGEATRLKYQKTIDLAKTGQLSSIEDFAPDLYLRHYSTLKRITMDNPRPLTDIDQLENEWIYGAPGVGKSRMARAENPGYYLKPHNKWWLGYKGQDTILIDDLDRDDARWIGQFLKNWCDHYPFHAETKGDGVIIRPKKFVVTSNYRIDELFDGVLAEAISRRFKLRHIVIPFNNQ